MPNFGYMQEFFKDKSIILKLTQFVDPFIRVIDDIVGEHVAMRVSICTPLLYCEFVRSVLRAV
jgi:hypothetical protein